MAKCKNCGTFSICVLGRRWFQKTNGNTYHTAEIFVNGDFKVRTPRCYGYGDHYMQTAHEWLQENGYLPSGSDATASLWWVCDDNGINLTYTEMDVPRRMDL